MSDPEALREELIDKAIRQKVPLVSLDPTCEWTSSKDQAAVNALNAITHKNFEYGGAIYKNKEGLYCYSIPVTNGKPAEIRFRVAKEEGITLDGIYHSHPAMEAGAMNKFFSTDDVAMAEGIKLTSYIKNLETGFMRKYEPGKTKTTKQRYRGMTEEISSGDELENQAP